MLVRPILMSMRSRCDFDAIAIAIAICDYDEASECLITEAAIRSTRDEFNGSKESSVAVLDCERRN